MTTMTMKRCALYARVSTEEQMKQFGLPSQLTELRAEAKRRGYTIADEFADKGYSGGNLGRPELERLRQAVRDKTLDVILVHDPDRLARNLSHQLILVEEFEHAGVALEFVTTSFENTAEGKMFFQLKGVFAEYEKEKFKDRTQRGRREKARSGHVVSSISPYGYRYLGRADNEKGRYVIQPEEAAVIRRMFQWLVEDGISTRQIVIRLNASGVRPRRGGPWSTSTVRRILSSALYTGVQHYNRRKVINKRHFWRPPEEWIAVPIPAIISEELLVRALEQLRRNTVQLVGRTAHDVYLLKGLIRCDACGRRYSGCPSHGYRYYRCWGRDKTRNPYCAAPLLRALPIEGFVWAIVHQMIRQPDVLIEKFREFDRRTEIESGQILEERQRAQRRLAELERHQARLLEDDLQERHDRPTIEHKAKELAGQKAILEVEIQALDRRLTRSPDTARREARLRELSGTALQGLDRLDDSGRQQVLRHLVDEVRIRGNRVQIHGAFPGWEAGVSTKSRMARVGNWAQHEDVVTESQRALGRFVLEADLDSEPSISTIEVTV